MAGDALIAALRAGTPAEAAPANTGFQTFAMPELGKAGPNAIRPTGGLLHPVDFSKQRTKAPTPAPKQPATPQPVPPDYGYAPWNPDSYLPYVGQNNFDDFGSYNSTPPVAPMQPFSPPPVAQHPVSPDYGYAPWSPDSYLPGDFGGHNFQQPAAPVQPAQDYAAPTYEQTYTPNELIDPGVYNQGMPFTFEEPAQIAQAPAPAAMNLDSSTPAQSADYEIAQILSGLPELPALSAAPPAAGPQDVPDVNLAAFLAPYASAPAPAAPEQASEAPVFNYDTDEPLVAFDERDAKAMALFNALMQTYQQPQASDPAPAPAQLMVPFVPQEPEFPYWYGAMNWGEF